MEDNIRTLYGALMIVSSTTSTCANLLLLLVLLLQKQLHANTMGFTLTFSLSDLALGLVVAIGARNSLVQSDGYSSESVFCQGSGFALLFLQTSSIQGLTWTTIDKFTELCFALSYSSIWTTGRSRAMLVLIWLFCLVNAALPLLGFGSYAYSKSQFLCCPSCSPENRSFVMLWMVLGVALPIVAMCFLYGYIIYVARKQARKGKFRCNELHCFHVPAKNYLRSSIVMVAASVCLLVCWLPYISVCLYETFSGLQSPEATSAFSAWLVLSTAALNPWINCFTQTRFRAAVHQSVCRFFQRCSGTPVEAHTQSSVVHLDYTNHKNTTTICAPLDTPTPP